MRSCDEIAGMSDVSLLEFVGKPLSAISSQCTSGSYAVLSPGHDVPSKWSKKVFFVYKTKKIRQEEYYMNLTAKKWTNFYISTHPAGSPISHAMLYKREQLPKGGVAYIPCTSIMLSPKQVITQISNAWVKQGIEIRMRPMKRLKIVFKI